MAPRSALKRAEVGSEGAPKPKPLKPFNVTFKTRLGKYVTMVSLCGCECECVCVGMHNRHMLSVCVCVKFLKCQKVFAASPGIINSATFNKRQLRETDNARAREGEREESGRETVRSRERELLRKLEHMSVYATVGCLQLFAAITFK